MTPPPAAASPSGVVLALDVGTKTIGVARSDPSRRFVFTDRTLARRSVAKDVAELVALCQRERVAQVVVGLPVPEPGQEPSRTVRLARQVGEALAVASGLPVEWSDEGFTTVEADTRLAEAGMYGTRRKARVDMQAAAVILEDWLERTRERV